MCFIRFDVIEFEHEKLSLIYVNRKNVDHLHYSKKIFEFLMQQMMTNFLNRSISFDNEFIHHFRRHEKH